MLCIIQKIDINKTDKEKYIVLRLKDISTQNRYIFARIYNESSSKLYNYCIDTLDIGDYVKVDVISCSNSKNYYVKNIKRISPNDFIFDHEIFYTLSNLILSARTEIIIGSPWIGDVGIFFDLIELKIKKGVMVTIILRPIIKKKNYYFDPEKVLERLFDLGCKIYLNEKIHFKIYITDNVLFNTSANLTPNGMLRSHEAGTLTYNYKTVKKARAYINWVLAISKKYELRTVEV